MLTFEPLGHRLKHPTAMYDGSNKDPITLDTVDDAIGVDETLSDRRHAEFRHDSPHFRKRYNRFNSLDDLGDHRSCIPSGITLDIRRYRLKVFDRLRGPD